ncbi:MAG TPA: amino acid ABC transporter permease [Candidatus Dormibacteraeota bacterium]|nr:amino acid ABC transporter permease [Candidatus Dormibacteraeota bacterium]
MTSDPGRFDDSPLLVAGGPPSNSLGGGRRHSKLQGRRAVAVSVASSVVLLGVLAALFFFAPGSAQVRQTFFNIPDARTAFLGDPRGGIFSELDALLINIELFLTAEVLILILAMVIALIRQLTGPVTFPLRMIAIAYTDFFRGVPLLLVVYAIGFGVPALNLAGVSTQPVWVYGLAALVLSYSAYVSEVYRAGIDSVHPSQVAAARSLGLSHGQAMRSVVIPQAVRRVIPPLLNDFISLQKDTALVAVLGIIEVNRAAGIVSSTDFNYTGYTVGAFLFLLLTVPMARFTDWLIARDRRRRQAGVAH